MTTYLDLPGTSGNYASSPDSAALSITSDIDIRVKVAMDDWTPAALCRLMSKSNTGSGTISYILSVISATQGTAGCLRLTLSSDGTNTTAATSSVATGVTDGAVKWVRATWRNSDNRVQFFTSDDGSSWTQLGTDQSINLTGIFNSTAVLEIGSDNLGTQQLAAGNFYRVQIRSNVLDDGTGIVFDADFEPITIIGTRNPTSFSESSSNAATVTLNGTTWDWGTAAGGATASPAVAALTTSVPAATLSAGSTPTPAVAALTTTVPAPALSAGSTPAPAVAALVLSVPAVTASGSGSATASPDPAALVLTPLAPSVTAGSSASPAAAPLVLTPLAVTLSAGASVAPGVATLVLTPQAPTATGQSNATTTPDPVALTIVAPAPSTAAGSTASPAVALLVLTPLAPNLSAGSTATPAVVGLVLVPRQVTATSLIVVADPNPYRRTYTIDHRAIYLLDTRATYRVDHRESYRSR